MLFIDKEKYSTADNDWYSHSNAFAGVGDIDSPSQLGHSDPSHAYTVGSFTLNFVNYT